MKQINDLIEMSKKYWKTGNNEYLKERDSVMEEIEEITGINDLGDFVANVVSFYCLSTNIRNPQFTNEDVYKVLESATGKNLRDKENQE